MAAPTSSPIDLRRLWVALGFAVLLLASGCGSQAAKVTAKPSAEDAFRLANAATDPILSVKAPFLQLSTVEQHPFACAAEQECSPRVGVARLGIKTVGGTRAQATKFYLEKLAVTGWKFLIVHCDDTKNEFFILASKSANSGAYNERLEIFQAKTSQIQVTVPAVGDESSFTALPDQTAYPTDACPTEIKTAAAKAEAESAKSTSGTTVGTRPIEETSPTTAK